MKYIDGFVVPVPKKNLAAYKRLSTWAGKVWRKHGALEYIEAVGDDLKIKGMYPFTKTVNCKPSETVVFSYIVYRSRAHRDKVNAKVMKDPGLLAKMEKMVTPFDCKRMAYGGFKVFVKA